ncbi:FCD domain-containing protein [Neomegalonema sp.]|uniref:FCD domain-containing protein n=1 Tax=Neomegalonema sp. TaxID=2039713 RepID=UPI0026136124|nr:FCD domain-containing protein [Neomegalonema sp.]MDD2870267.1 FCD domain-containing protein [Neomegalonema sp.]
MTLRPSVKPVKLAEAVALKLEDLIRDGALRPGDRLAPERDLAEKLGVSRPSLREGIRILERSGLLAPTPKGEGARVAAIGATLADPLVNLLRSRPESAFDYLEFRGAVEPMAAAHAAQRAAEPDRIAVARALERIEAAHLAANPSDEADADAALHLAIYEASHNAVLLHVMRALAEMLRDKALYSRDEFFARSGMRETLLRQPREIVAALLARDAEAARLAAQRHIAFTVEALGEIRAAEARLEASLRRLGRAGLAVEEEQPEGLRRRGD